MTITLSDTTTTLTQNKYNFGKDSNRNDTSRRNNYNFSRDYYIWARPSEVGLGRARAQRARAPQGKGGEGICGMMRIEIFRDSVALTAPMPMPMLLLLPL